jgi:transposase-like protein
VLLPAATSTATTPVALAPPTGPIASARVFFERAITSTEVTPARAITDKAKCYPPALRAVLANVEHPSSR